MNWCITQIRGSRINTGVLHLAYLVIFKTKIILDVINHVGTNGFLRLYLL